MNRFTFYIIILLPLALPFSANAAIEMPICTEAGFQGRPDISGDRIVWEDGRDASYAIYMYDFADGTTVEIPTGGFLVGFPSISGVHVIWKEVVDENFSSFNIYCHNVISGETQEIETGISFANFRPISISGNKIIRNYNQKKGCVVTGSVTLG